MGADIDSLCWQLDNTDGGIVDGGASARTLTIDKILSVIEECNRIKEYKPVVYILKLQNSVIWACNLPQKPRFIPSKLADSRAIYAVVNLGIVGSEDACGQLEKLIRLEWSDKFIDFKEQMEKLFGVQNEDKI